jgi:hypothetical protein
MTKCSSISTLIVFAAVAWVAASALDRVEISKDAIAAAIRNDGIQAKPEQLTLLTTVVSAGNSPRLQVESVVPWGDHRIRVRLRCSGAGECLPFLVSLNLDPTSVPAYKIDGVSPVAVPDRQQGLGTLAVRAGSPATLLIDEDRIHIRVPVICLESGSTGRIIRAVSKDRKQTYHAEVIGTALLKGGL